MSAEDDLAFASKRATGASHRLDEGALHELAPNAPAELVAMNGAVYFAATSQDNHGLLNGGRQVERELWKSDGTTAGTVLVNEHAHGF